jgi:hypothetical protein
MTFALTTAGSLVAAIVFMTVATRIAQSDKGD